MVLVRLVFIQYGQPCGNDARIPFVQITSITAPEGLKFVGGGESLKIFSPICGADTKMDCLLTGGRTISATIWQIVSGYQNPTMQIKLIGAGLSRMNKIAAILHDVECPADAAQGICDDSQTIYEFRIEGGHAVCTCCGARSEKISTAELMTFASKSHVVSTPAEVEHEPND